MKKALKIIGLVFLLFIVLLFTLPIMFKGKIFDMVTQEANKNLTADVSIGDVDLSLIQNFPKFTITISNVKVIGREPFENVPLADIDEITATVDVMSVINGEQINIHTIGIADITSHVIVLDDGTANYDIVASSNSEEVSSEEEEITEESTEDEASLLNVQIQEYYFRNAHIIYDDRQGDLMAELINLSHSGKGDFTLDEFLFETKTTADEITVEMEGIKYMNKVSTDITFNFMMDLPNAKYTFDQNEIKLNELSLSFDGWVQMPNDDIDMDLTFATNKTDFKSLLSLVPSAYTADFADVQTSGNLKLEGMAKGTYADNDGVMQLPGFDVSLLVDNARFQYPDLPKAAENIQINVRAQNPGGSEDNMIVDVNTFHVELAQNPIDFQLHVKHPVSDPDLKGALQAQINLESLADVIPMEEGESYSGSITSDIRFAGKMSSIENENYEAFDANGKLIILGMNYTSSALPYKVDLKKMYLEFAPQFVSLTSFEAQVGKSDFSANGRIDNLLAYYFKEEMLHGEFNLNSTYLDVNEFMEESTDEGETTSENPSEETTDEIITDDTSSVEGFAVPGNINFEMNTNINTIRYDQMDITDLNGKLIIKDETIDMQRLAMNLLKGSMIMSGSYSTKNTPRPKVSFAMDMNEIDITETAVNFNTIEQMAPIMKSAKGAVSIDMNMKGMLDDSLNMDLMSVDAVGKLHTHRVMVDNEKLELIDEKLKVNKFNPLPINDVDIDFTIKDGKLETSPFDVKAGDVNSTIYGYTNLEQQINYTIDSEVPFDALGGDVSKLAGSLANQLQSAGFGNGNIPEDIEVSISVTGDMTNPKIKPNFKGANGASSSVKEQAKEVVKEQIDNAKEEISKKAKEEADKLMADAKVQADKLVAEARAQGDNLRKEGNKAADKIRAEADKQAKDLVKQANNPLAKIGAEAAAQKLRDEAEKQAKNVEAEADKKANQLEDEAKKQADAILNKAQEEADKKLNGQ